MERMMRETVLVTGATGFLGGYLIHELTEQGYRILAVGRNLERGRELAGENCTFYPVDFTVKQELEVLFQRESIDYVIHAGALSSAWGTWEDFYQCNVIATGYVAELALQYQVKRLVYLSSPSVYSEKRDRFDIQETDADPDNHLNYYIMTKLQSERLLQEFVQKGLYTVILRPRGLIGKGDPSLMPRLMKANQKIGIPLFNQGKNLVDITCVENVAYACCLALTAENVNGEVFNITNGEPSEFRKLLEEFCEASGETAKFRPLPFPLIYGLAGFLEWFYKVFHLKGEPILTRYTVCTLAFSQTLNIEKAEKRLHYIPKLSLLEGIRAYGAWWRTIQ